MDLPFVLVGSVVIAAGLGYLLDKHFNTSPIFTLVLGALGFAGGMYRVDPAAHGKKAAGSESRWRLSRLEPPRCGASNG